MTLYHQPKEKRRLQDEIGELSNEDLDNYVNVFA